MAENLEDLIREREEVVNLYENVHELFLSKSSENANILSDAIVDYLVGRNTNLDSNEISFILYCKEISGDTLKRFILQDLNVEKEKIDFLERHFSEILKSHHVYYGFNTKALGLNSTIYLSIEILKKELELRGFKMTLKNGLIEIRYYVSSLKKDINCELDIQKLSGKKSVMDVQKARLAKLTRFRAIIQKLEEHLVLDTSMFEKNILKNIMERLSFLSNENVDLSLLELPVEVEKLDYYEFDLCELKKEINEKANYFKNAVRQIVIDNCLCYVYITRNSPYLVNFSKLVAELEQRNLRIIKDEAREGGYKIRAVIPSREEIVSRKLEIKKNGE